MKTTSKYRAMITTETFGEQQQFSVVKTFCETLHSRTISTLDHFYSTTTTVQQNFLSTRWS